MTLHEDSVARDLERFEAILRLNLPKIRDRYGVAALGIFGSYVSGQANAKSDLDVLVEYRVDTTVFKFWELEEYLSKLVGVKVDLMFKSTLRPTIPEHILAQVVML